MMHIYIFICNIVHLAVNKVVQMPPIYFEYNRPELSRCFEIWKVLPQLTPSSSYGSGYVP